MQNDNFIILTYHSEFWTLHFALSHHMVQNATLLDTRVENRPNSWPFCRPAEPCRTLNDHRVNAPIGF